MEFEYEIRRYTAYLRGFCQAFGEHEGQYEESSDINWLLANEQVGLILSPEVKRTFYRVILGRETVIPTLRLSQSSLQLGDLKHPLEGENDMQGLQALRQLIQQESPTHLYLTYHFIYPPGTRIVTFSKQRPLPIFYKKMRPLKVVLIFDAD
jgi:hypothetical protein